MRQKYALLSVFDKTGIVEFAQGLVDLDFKLIASGGTAKKLVEAGLPVMDVAELVGGEAILGHRVVTLSREIHAGLLARDNAEDLAELNRLGVPFIDLVCVDCYPLEAAIAKPEATLESVIESTDIGGPTMLRAGAKGSRIVLCQVEQRELVLSWLRDGMPNRSAFISGLAGEAERYCAKYGLVSSNYRLHSNADEFVVVHREVVDDEWIA